jgi:signal transduction histidine kinase
VIEKDIQFVIEIDEAVKRTDLEVLVDEQRMAQVYSNILHNAVKHTPDGGTVVTRCFLGRNREFVVFQVSDSGDGIARGEQPLVFRTFYRSDNNAQIEGMGLGLNLAKQIVTAHQGKISVKSEQGTGSTFQFTIPIFRETEG